MNSLKPISISLSPNTEKDDIALAFKLLFQPNKWKRGKETELLEKQFKEYLGLKYAFSFNSGRSALMAILNALPLMSGDEILLQAFTCNASANPILWSGFKPVFVDCDKKTFNLDPEDLKRKITSRSRAVMVQHTFGLPANLNEILAICRQRNLLLIEDCAHSLGAEYQGQKVGTFGQVAFFSFSRDKIISSVYGGMAVTNDDRLAEKMRLFQQKAGYPSMFWIGQQLLHPVLMNWLILSTYRILGKYLLILFQWLRILSKAVHWKEKRGLRPDYFPKRLPRALAFLALNQFKKIEKFNSYRLNMAKFYAVELATAGYDLPKIIEGNVFLRFSVKHALAHKIIKKAWRNNLLLGDWYTTPIAPHDTKLEKIGYQIGSCPQAEKLAEIVLNLPTHINISMAEAHRIVRFLKEHGN
jgi:dTDP-4-amino-4,6-dideoxygalactose transaminase